MEIGKSVGTILRTSVFDPMIDLIRKSVHFATYYLVMITVRDSMWTIIFVRDGDR